MPPNYWWEYEVDQSAPLERKWLRLKSPDGNIASFLACVDSSGKLLERGLSLRIYDTSLTPAEVFGSIESSSKLSASDKAFLKARKGKFWKIYPPEGLDDNANTYFFGTQAEARNFNASMRTPAGRQKFLAAFANAVSDSWYANPMRGLENTKPN